MVQEKENVLNIDTYAQCKMYLDNLPPNHQIRYISKTSRNGKFAVVCVVYDVQFDRIIVNPYNLNQAHTGSEPVESTETIEDLAIRVVKERTGLISRNVKILGAPFHKRDKKGNILPDSIPKYLILITEYEGELKQIRRGEKIGPCVWFKRELAVDFFIQTRQTQNGKVRHPHFEADKRFREDFPLIKDLERW